MKHTEENVKKQKVVNDKLENEKNIKPGRASFSKAKGSNGEYYLLFFISLNTFLDPYIAASHL